MTQLRDDNAMLRLKEAYDMHTPATLRSKNGEARRDCSVKGKWREVVDMERTLHQVVRICSKEKVVTSTYLRAEREVDGILDVETGGRGGDTSEKLTMRCLG